MIHPFTFLKERKDIMACCLDFQSNLKVEQQPNNVLKGQCKRCGRRHFLMNAESFDIGQVMRSLGSNDRKRAVHPHAKGEGGPPPGRKIILP